MNVFDKVVEPPLIILAVGLAHTLFKHNLKAVTSLIIDEVIKSIPISLLRTKELTILLL